MDLHDWFLEAYELIMEIHNDTWSPIISYGDP